MDTIYKLAYIFLLSIFSLNKRYLPMQHLPNQYIIFPYLLANASGIFKSLPTMSFYFLVGLALFHIGPNQLTIHVTIIVGVFQVDVSDTALQLQGFISCFTPDLT